MRRRIQTAQWNTADDPRVDGEGDEILNALLVSDGSNRVRQAYPEIDDAVWHQLHCGTAGNDLPFIEPKRSDLMRKRDPRLAREPGLEVP